MTTQPGNNKIIFDYVISHKNCSDGQCAAWIAKKFGPVDECTKYIELEAGKPVSLTDFNFKNTDILMLDIMVSNIFELSREALFIKVIDHHITNKASIDLIQSSSVLNIELIYDVDRCGTELTWDEYAKSRNIKFIGTSYPWFINVIADRDLWRWSHDFSKELGKFLFVNSKYDNFDDLMEWNQEQINHAIREGKKLLETDKKTIDWMVNSAIPATLSIPGFTYKVMITSGNGMFFSEVGDILSKKEDCDIAAMWKYDLKTDEWWISLRSSDKGDGELVNVGKIAKHFNGGGHAKASGFTIKGGNGIRSVFNIC